jgi:hypothetical protein
MERGTSKHPAFTSAAKIMPDKLDPKQIGAVMHWLREPGGSLDSKQQQRAIRRCLPQDAAKEFIPALDQAGVCDANIYIYMYCPCVTLIM